MIPRKLPPLITATLLASLCIPACTTELPPVDPTQFACEGNVPDEAGNLPCPDTHWCRQGHCEPRFNCKQPTGKLGCVAGQTRCDLLPETSVAAVACGGGVHTSTSARLGAATCACPDGTVCVGVGPNVANERYPLFVLPTPSGFPASTINTPEVAAWRVCARACSSEVDCSAGHVCRAATVANDEWLADVSSPRHTIGVCYPSLLIDTASTARPLAVPDRDACGDSRECPTGSRACAYRVVDIPDHPIAPAGDGWPRHAALIARCVPASGLKEPGLACLEHAEYTTGVCVRGRCGVACHPLLPGGCGTGRFCKEQLVSREIPGGAVVDDYVHICEQ